uniref:Uncharacterized protein n=1 Tax=Rhizophora mucronata TaxID=61149 RepID=A0A2P2PL68_RHIMU
MSFFCALLLLLLFVRSQYVTSANTPFNTLYVVFFQRTLLLDQI